MRTAMSWEIFVPQGTSAQRGPQTRLSAPQGHTLAPSETPTPPRVCRAPRALNAPTLVRQRPPSLARRVTTARQVSYTLLSRCVEVKASLWPAWIFMGYIYFEGTTGNTPECSRCSIDPGVRESSWSEANHRHKLRMSGDLDVGKHLLPSPYALQDQLPT